MTRIAVVGGGIAGLAAAWELSGVDGVEVTVHEASPGFGGKILTSPFAGRPVDEGADAFLRRVPWALDLVHELGLDDELISPAERKAYVWSRGQLRPLPREHVLGVPLDLDDLATTGLLDDDELAETRRALDAVAPDAPVGDVSVADLVTAAVGRPALERVVAPLIGGINAGRAEDMSAAALTPQLLAAARGAGGLVAGLRAQRAAADPSAPIFASFESGTGRLVQALIEQLARRGVDLRPGAPVPSLGHLDADGIVLAVPAFTAHDLLADVSPGAAGLLGTIGYASVTLVTFAVDASRFDRSLDASGFLVPRAEGLLLTACSWTSSKWAHLAGDPLLLRASAGSAGDDRAAGSDDDELVEQLWADLGTTMSLTGRPDGVRISRWARSFPQYAVGHLDLVADIDATLTEEHPGVVLAGAAYRGVGVPACIHDGRSAARRLLDARG